LWCCVLHCGAAVAAEGHGFATTADNRRQSQTDSRQQQTLDLEPQTDSRQNSDKPHTKN
jgi:hypothetical protein